MMTGGADGSMLERSLALIFEARSVELVAASNAEVCAHAISLQSSHLVNDYLPISKVSGVIFRKKRMRVYSVHIICKVVTSQ